MKWQQITALKLYYTANEYGQVDSNQNVHSVGNLQIVLMMLNSAGSKNEWSERIIKTPQLTGGIVTGSYKNSPVVHQLTNVGISFFVI